MKLPILIFYVILLFLLKCSRCNDTTAAGMVTKVSDETTQVSTEAASTEISEPVDYGTNPPIVQDEPEEEKTDAPVEITTEGTDIMPPLIEPMNRCEENANKLKDHFDRMMLTLEKAVTLVELIKWYHDSKQES